MKEQKEMAVITAQGVAPAGKERTGKRSAAVNAEHKKMLLWLKMVKFRRQLFGGVSEADVWTKLSELNEMYEASLTAERARYNALLSHYQKETAAQLEEYREALHRIQAGKAARQAAKEAANSAAADSEVANDEAVYNEAQQKA